VKLFENYKITGCNGRVPYVVLASALIESRVQKLLGRKNKREYDSIVCYIYPSVLNKKYSRGKILSQLDATYGIDGTDYQYLCSWTQKMAI
jgi:hypothetical protein